MSGLLSVPVSEERGFVAVPAELDRLAVVVGCSSLGSGMSSFFLSGPSAVAALGYGDSVDTLGQIVEQRQSTGGTARKYPAAHYTTTASTPGSAGAVDSDGITGSGVVTMGATTPLGTYQAGLLWVTSGVVGTAGMLIKWTLDGGRHWSAAVALSTATNYTIPNSGVKFQFSPSAIDTTALNTLLNELSGDYEAHRVLTVGSVHGAADSTNAITAAAATNTATRIALANDLRAMYNAHRILTAGGVHGAVDSTNVITAPVATDDSTALALALDIQAKYNAHIVLVAGGVHGGSGDTTNDSDSPAPAAGTFNAGDDAYCDTLGPVPDTTAVAAAFTALAAASAQFALVVCDFPCDAAMAAVVTTGMNALATAGKLCTCLTRARLPDWEASESEATWAASVEADFGGYTDSRLVVRATYNLITDALTSRQYLRSTLAQLAADSVRVGRSLWPACPNDRAEPNVTMVDASGILVGHDEGPRGNLTGLSNDDLGNRFSCEQRLADPNRAQSVYNTVPWVMYDVDEGIRNLMTRRLANAMEREARSAAIPQLGGRLFYVSTGSGTGTLTAASRKAVHGSIYDAIKTQFADEIENAADAALDSGLVQVSPSVTVSGGNLLTVSATLSPRVAGYVLSIPITMSIQE